MSDAPEDVSPCQECECGGACGKTYPACVGGEA
jgi:hypothetical protein